MISPLCLDGAVEEDEKRDALAALMAEGESRVEGWEHAERGYESFTEILSELGGRIRKETEKEENSKVLKNETEEPKVLL